MKFFSDKINTRRAQIADLKFTQINHPNPVEIGSADQSYSNNLN